MVPTHLLAILVIPAVLLLASAACSVFYRLMPSMHHMIVSCHARPIHLESSHCFDYVSIRVDMYTVNVCIHLAANACECLCPVS